MSRGIKGLTALLVVVGVPVGVGTLAAELIAANPLTAGLTLAVYWLLLGVVGLVSTVVRDPSRRRASRLGDALDAALGRRFSRYTRHYRDWAARADTRVGFTGTGIARDRTPEPDAVYVDVAVERTVNRGGAAEPTARGCIDAFLDHAEPAVLAVVGGPGCGKTTLLRHLAGDTARRDSRRRRIPVFLSPNRLTDSMREGLSLPELLRVGSPSLPVPEPRGWWEQQLHSGNCLVLVDGLDEVAGDADRRRVADWIAEQINVYGGNDFVIASRPGDYRLAPIPGARILAVQPFTTAQIDRFLHGWYLAAERETTGANDPGVEAVATEKAEDLIDRLSDAPGLDESTSNPLLLTMIALVHRYRGALPRGRADLYEESCRAMLWSRREAQGVAVGLSGQAKWDVLAQLAHHLMTIRRRDIGVERLPAAIADALDAKLPGVACEEFLREVCEDGLLIERERDRYAFAHQTIGEYLAARHLLASGLADGFEHYVDDAWWAETLELYAASTRDLGGLIEAGLKKNTVGSVAQAFTFAGYDGRRSDWSRGRLRRLEDAALSSNAGPVERQALARALVSRQFKSLQRLNDDNLYCPSPVSAKLYWLHHNEPGEKTPGGDPSPQPGNLTGLWPEDVVPFVDWINKVNGHSDRTGSSFRLPNRDESKLIHARNPELGPIWRATARGSELPFTVTAADLRALVTADVAALGLATAAVFALLRNLVVGVGRRSAEAVTASRPVDFDDRLRRCVETADAEGFRDLVGGLHRIPPQRTADHSQPGRPAVADAGTALEQNVLGPLKQGLGRAYQASRPKSFGWLPPSAAVFAGDDGAEAVATRLAGGRADVSENPLAELLLDRAGVAETPGLTVVIGSTATTSSNPRIALRDSVAPPGRWHESVSRELAEKARRLLSRQDRLTDPGVLRLTGLIAAAEFEAERNQLNRDACLKVVALVTALENRTRAENPGEALILVRD